MALAWHGMVFDRLWWEGVGWGVVGLDGMGLDGMGLDGMGWVGMEWGGVGGGGEGVGGGGGSYQIARKKLPLVVFGDKLTSALNLRYYPLQVLVYTGKDFGRRFSFRAAASSLPPRRRPRSLLFNSRR